MACRTYDDENNGVKNIFLLCRSGSGKSSILRLALTKESCKWARQLILINVKPDEAQHYQKCHSAVKRYNSIKEIQHNTPERSIVVVEDIINMSKDEEIIFRYFLNEHAHHKTLKMFCVGHTLYKTSLYGMLSLFNYILFTSTPSNIPLLKQTLAYFRIEKDQIDEYVETFGDKKSFGHYYYLDCQSMTMSSLDASSGFKGGGTSNLGSDDHEAKQKRREKLLLERFGLFFEDHPEKIKAKALLSILLRAIPESVVRDVDCTARFQHKRGEKYISLIDYISLLLDTKAGTILEREQQVLHLYIKSKCQLPRYLVLNRTLQ